MPDYVDFPIETNPDVLAEQSYTYLQSIIPGWVPNEGNLETIMVDVFARLSAIDRDLASQVPVTIFRYFGKLVGVNPNEAAKATAQATFAAINNKGYTVPSGTQVGIRVSGDVLIPFETITDIVIPSGSTSMSGTILAITAGAGSSDLGDDNTELELIQPTFDWIDTIALDETTVGGVDAETDRDYLDRLSNKLALLADRPILAPDFAVLARDIPSVWRSMAIDLYKPAVNEIQSLTIDAESGTFTLTFDGQTAAGLAFDIGASALQTALESLSNIDPGDVQVTGGPGATSPLLVEFTGTLAGANQPAMTTNAAGLSGGAATAVVATLQAGAAADTQHERAVTIVSIDRAGEAQSSPIKTAVMAYLQELREQNFEIYSLDPEYTTVDVQYEVTGQRGFSELDLKARVESALANYLDPAVWGMPDAGSGLSARDWVNKPVIREYELSTVINNVIGIDFIDPGGLTFGVQGGSMSSDDLTMSGVAPLPRAGNITGTVTVV